MVFSICKCKFMVFGFHHYARSLNLYYIYIILYIQYIFNAKYAYKRTDFSFYWSHPWWNSCIHFLFADKVEPATATEGYLIFNSFIPKFFWKKIGSPEWGETIFWLKNGVIGSRKLGRGNIARKIIIEKNQKHHLTKTESIFQFLEIRSWSET